MKIRKFVFENLISRFGNVSTIQSNAKYCKVCCGSSRECSDAASKYIQQALSLGKFLKQNYEIDTLK